MRKLWTIAILFMVVAPISAQECERNETPGQCMARLAPAVVGETADAAEEQTEETTAEAATGITNTSSAAESPLKDFLSLFAASVESATTSQTGQAFTFDWNPKLSFAPNLGAKLQASFPETKLNDTVSAKLAANAAKLQEFNDSLEFGDDSILSGFVEPESPTHGRSIDAQRGWFRPMRDVMLAPRRAEDKELNDLRLKHDRMLATQPFDRNRDGTLLQDEEKIKERLKDFTALFKSRAEARTGRSAFFMAFAKLLNNQPQFYGAVIFHARRNVIGPNEWSAKVTYEYGGNNLNAFRKAHPECGLKAFNITEPGNTNEAAAKNKLAEGCAADLTAFADATRAGIERIALSLEAHKSNRRWINDAAAGLDLGFPATRSFVGSLAFGTNTSAILPLKNETTGVGDARLDFTAKYVVPEDNDKDRRGFVGSLTYTQKVSETFSLPISLVYSDHKSDLLNVQKRFSTKFGLMYKLPDLK